MVDVVPPQRRYDEVRPLYDRAIQTWERTGDPKLVDVVTSKADMYMQQVRGFELGTMVFHGRGACTIVCIAATYSRGESWCGTTVNSGGDVFVRIRNGAHLT